MAIQVGDKAPDFSAITQDGKIIRLADYIGKRALVLFFYPRDGTPICTQENLCVSRFLRSICHSGAEVVGVSNDTEQRHREFADTAGHSPL